MKSDPKPREAKPDEIVVRHHRLALTFGVLLAVFTAVMLPVALGSIIRELVIPPERETYYLVGEPPPTSPSGSSGPLDVAYVNLALVGVDEAEGQATVRVSGYRACPTTCAAYTLVLFSLGDGGASQLGLPPLARVRLPEDESQVTATVELPVRGQPSLYPWDSYILRLGATVETTLPDGAPVAVRPGDYPVASFVALQSQLQRLQMGRPNPVDPATVRLPTDPAALLFVRELRFYRPLYQMVLTPLLVVLSAAAAAYSVQMQPIQQLFIGCGSLVLGVWGIRSVLVPGGAAYTTAVDLLLTLVILILLGGIIGRATLHLIRQEGGRPASS